MAPTPSPTAPSAPPLPNFLTTLAPGFLVSRAHGSQWDLLVTSLLNAMSMPAEAGVHADWLDHFERNVALFLLSHQPPGIAPALGFTGRARALESPDAVLRAGDTRRMGTLIEYMESRLGAPISLRSHARISSIHISRCAPRPGMASMRSRVRHSIYPGKIKRSGPPCATAPISRNFAVK